MLNLNNNRQKTEEILTLTVKIQKEFPGLYLHLDESSVITAEPGGLVTPFELDMYYESLQAQESYFKISRNWI